MAEKRKRKQKFQSLSEPTKEEMKIAKYVRFNTPKKTTVCQKMNVEYFVGSKAVDTLMASKWSKASNKSDAIFQTRSDAVKFLQLLLVNNMMYRAKKVLKEQKPSKENPSTKLSKHETKDQPDKNEESDKPRKRKKGKEADKKKDPEKTDEKSEKKKRKKYKLDLHDDQVFLDSGDLFVWIYDPVSAKKMLFGAIAVMGIIGVTLFPLWPPSVRVGVYYLSVCGGVFVGSILTTAVCRSILFAIIWGVTLGKHHFWFLPNLLADVGFFDSFKPVYTHEILEKEKAVKDKNSDSEDEADAALSSQDGATKPEDDEDAPPLEGDTQPCESSPDEDRTIVATSPSDGDKEEDKKSDDIILSNDYEVIDAESDRQ